jgi:carbohydrate diacid regulator
MVADRANMARHLAAALAGRLAGLLDAPIAIVDRHGELVAGERAAGAVWAAATPADLGNEAYTVMIGRSREGETVGRRQAEAIVQLAVRELIAAEQVRDLPELTDRLVWEVVRGTTSDGEGVLRTAQTLGVDLERPRAVLLIDAAAFILSPAVSIRGDGENLRSRRGRLRARQVQTSIARFFGSLQEEVTAYLGDGEIVLLKDCGGLEHGESDGQRRRSEHAAVGFDSLDALKGVAGRLRRWLDEDLGAAVAVAVGRHHPGMEGLARSYQEARIALSVGRQFGPGDRPHAIDTLGVAAFAGVEDHKLLDDLARSLTAPLEREPELVETLEIFFAEHCSVSAAAGRLCIHRNTLGYRLEKVAGMTGLDPRRFDDAVQLRLALLLRSMRGPVRWTTARCSTRRPTLSV